MNTDYRYKIVTVDPGIHTGWVLWGMPAKEIMSQGRFDEERDDRKLPLEKRIRLLSRRFFDTLLFNVFPSVPIRRIYIEGVNVYGNSLKSITSATRGNLVFLSMLVGAYLTVGHDFFDNVPVDIIDPRKWKGNLTAEALESWIKEYFGDGYAKELCVEHTREAVGMGMYILGLGGFGK